MFSVTNIPDDPAWRSAITRITVNGTALPLAAYGTGTAGVLTFDPSQSALLQTPGPKALVISATGYSTNSVTQFVAVGPAAKLSIKTQPTAPLGSGGPLVTQPVVLVQDQFNNNVTNSTASITAAAVQGTWTLGGTLTRSSVGGTNAFTGLTAYSPTAVTGATISFTSGVLPVVTSSPFNIPAPILPVIKGPVASGGKFVLNFTNVTGLSYSVLSTNDLTIPTANWPVIGNPIESPAGSGSYHFTNSPGTSPQTFYLLRQP
jgi:hypothetical protein